MRTRTGSLPRRIAVVTLMVAVLGLNAPAADIAAGREVPRKLSNFDRQTSWLPEVSVVQVYDVEGRPGGEPGGGERKPVDHAKGFPLRPYGDDAWINVWRVRTLRGDDAERFAALWRKMDFGGMGLMCHHPGYAVRCFDAAGKMILETSICWGCNNLFIRGPDGHHWVSFHSGNAEAQALLAHCRDLMKDAAAARVPGEAGADAIMTADPPAYVPDAVDAFEALKGDATDIDLATLRGYSGMQELSLFSQDISDKGLATLETLTGLTSLSLRTPHVGDAGLAHLRPLKKLVGLNLSCQGMTDAGLAPVADLTALQSLGLEAGTVTDAGMARLAALKDLRVLSVRGKGITDAGLAALAGMSKLESLSLESTGVRGPGLRALRSLKQLKELRLDRSAITDEGLAAVAELPALELLYLDSAASVTDAGMAHVARCPNVYRVSLEQTSIGDDGLQRLTAMPKLSYLHLVGTRITDASIDTLCAMPKLQYVWVRNSRVSEEGIARLKRERKKVIVQ